jgi:hypothetical protein
VVTVTARYDLAVVPSASPQAQGVGPFRVDGPFGCFADRLLALELPDLPLDRRTSTVAFVCRRADLAPTPLRMGIAVLTIGVGAARRTAGLERTTSFLQRTSLPFVAELARMVRSLGFTFVWETWPTTSPTGAPP